MVQLFLLADYTVQADADADAVAIAVAVSSEMYVTVAQKVQ